MIVKKCAPIELRLTSRYLQAQGLMKVPTYVLFFIAPLNVAMNYLLVSVLRFLKGSC